MLNYSVAELRVFIISQLWREIHPFMARSLGVTQKVSSNSKHTLLCLYGHHVLARINLIPLKTLRRFAQWLEAQSLQGTAHFLYAKG